MPYQAQPQIMSGTGGHSQRGWRATYVMSDDGGYSWTPGSGAPQKWRPWAWWASATARRMAHRVNARRTAVAIRRRAANKANARLRYLSAPGEGA